MLQTNFYFNYDGTTEKALRMYQAVLGGTFPVIMRMKDMPQMPGSENLREEDLQKMMHMCLELPNGTKLMATDAVEAFGHTVQQGNHFSLAVGTDSKEEADRIYNALSEGGSNLTGMKMEMWGDYFGSFTDQFGLQWMVSYAENPGQGEVFDKLESRQMA